MKIGVVCNDTRGGVEPYVALALALRDRGHEMRAVAPAGLASMFSDRGIDVAVLPRTEDATDFTASGIAERGTMAAMRLMRRELPARLEQWTRATIDACGGCDVLTGGIGGMATGLVAAEVLRLPWVPAHLQPLGQPTGLYPGALLPGVPAWLGAPGMLASHHLTELAAWLPFRAAMARVRKALGVTRGFDPTRGQPTLYGFSREVVPLPEDEQHIVTGYWRLPVETVQPLASELATFLECQKPVISVGFGSMGSADPSALVSLVIGAARRAGVRVVLLGAFRQRTNVQKDLLVVDQVAHDELFPRVDAIVHHGGAGTTGAAFTAGKPQIVVPFAVDQPFWASRVVASGCGPSPIRRRDLNETVLASRISAALSEPGYALDAKKLAANIARENSSERAANVFNLISKKISANLVDVVTE